MDYANDKGLRVMTQEFSQCMRELRTRLGAITKTLQQVVDPEVAKVLEVSLAKTKKANELKIRERVKNKRVFMINGKKVDMRWWPYRKKNGMMMMMPDNIAQEIEWKRERILNIKIAAMGLTANSWWLLSKKLGIAISAPSYVQSAKSRHPDSGDKNIAITRSGSGNKYGVKVENYMPLLKWPTTEGTQAFFAALAGRIGFFRNNVKHGVFNEVQSIAKKYKGIVVRK